MTQTPFQLDDKAFERGHLWTELLESWQIQRDAFLKAVLAAQPLPALQAALAKLPAGTRLAVYHRMRSPNSSAWLSNLGPELHQASHLEVRFFAFEYFFPIFYQLELNFPRFILVNEQGLLGPQWSPENHSGEAINQLISWLHNH